MNSIVKSIRFPALVVTEAYEGDAIAQLELGKSYYNTTLVGSNIDKAFGWIYRSAEQGNMEAQFRLGDFYALGYGTSKSSFDAYKWYTKSAIQGYKKALIRIHNLYQDDTKMHCRGQINSEEDEWADDDFKKENTIRELNEYRLEQKKSILNGTISHYTEQFRIYKSSNQEDPYIQLNLAFFYQHGYGVKKCTRWAFEYYTLAANQGNIDAQYNLGDLYRKHNNMKFNYLHAFKWLTKSAQGRNRIAQRSLAYFYLKGLATDIDHDVAFFWYTKAAEAGDSEAMVTLGRLYRKGDYIRQDLSMAIHWYTLAARQGNIVAQNCLSQLHQRGMLDNIQLDEDMLEYLTESSMNSRLCTRLFTDVSRLKDSPKFKQLNELAKRALIGDGQAMYEIGLEYLKGDNEFALDEGAGVKWIKNAAVAKNKCAQLIIAEIYKKDESVEQDYHRSVIWYKKLARQKDAVAQCVVGVMYNEGLGVRKDPLEASKWFIWAADQGNSDAQYNLARLRLEGRGLAQDENEAVELYHQSAKQRNIRSCCKIGEIYLEGRYEVDKNEARGLKLMEFAAENGSIQAQLEMARRVKEGNGVLNCRQNEIGYLTMAADAGSTVAQYQLGAKYLEGDGVDQDYVKAYTMFEKADYFTSQFAQDLVHSLNTHYIYISDYSRILEMFIEVTEKGINNLQYSIGIAYEFGIKRCGSPCFDSNQFKAKEWYMAASKIGDFGADYRLGIMHDDNKIFTSDRVISYYERASLRGYSYADYKLACIYNNKYSINHDPLKTFHYYTKASIMGHLKASKELTIPKYIDSNPIYYDYSSAKFLPDLRDRYANVDMLEIATEKGYTRLQYQLGVWYESKNDYSSAFKWFSLATDIGITDAYYRVGVSYEKGKGVKQDYSVAVQMYYKAAEKEHEEACYRLGLLYQYGKGVKRDDLKAYQFYKKADHMGHVKACKILNITLDLKIDSNDKIKKYPLDPSSRKYKNSLSMCKYVAGHGDIDVQFKVGFAYEYCISEPSYVEAYKWYSWAARGSHREAIYHLGLLHENGLGTSQDYQKAIRLYEQASKLSSDDALYRLGYMYHHGNGVGIDPEKAMEYYTVAANLGNPEYQYSLGRLYEKGELVPKNLLETLKWYTKAYIQGYDNINTQLNDIYNDKPYENFFYERLIRNLSIASRGNFRLRKEYSFFDYSSINYRLGVFYALGYGTKKDLTKAWNYFSKEYSDCAFKTGYIAFLELGPDSSKAIDILKTLDGDEALLSQITGEHLFELGMVFFLGELKNRDYSIIIGEDYSTAFKYLTKAAAKKNSDAILQLGMTYHYCHYINEESEQNEKELQSAANDNIGDVERVFNVYCTSEENQNLSVAFKLYKHLEEGLTEDLDDDKRKKINGKVQAGLGLLYEDGDYIRQDYQKSLKYYEKAAENGNLFGFHRLALMYYHGKGVSIDYEKAFGYFEKADKPGEKKNNRKKW